MTEPVLLVGETGTGKTALVQQLARVTGKARSSPESDSVRELPPLLPPFLLIQFSSSHPPLWGIYAQAVNQYLCIMIQQSDNSSQILAVRLQAGAGGAARIPFAPCAPGHLLIHGVYPKLKRLRSPRGGRRLAVFRHFRISIDIQPPAARRPYSIAWVIAASPPLHLWTDHGRAMHNKQSDLFRVPWV
jgi:hypothetical protein